MNRVVYPLRPCRNPPCLPPPALFLPLPFPMPFLSLPSLYLEVGPVKSSWGSGQRCKLPQRGLEFGAFQP